MVENLEEKDVIKIDLQQLFGKVIQFSADDAERIIQADTDPSIVFVLSHRDHSVFRTHVDTVIMDITPKLSYMLYEDGSIVTGEEFLQVEIKKDLLKQNGLMVLDEAIQLALTTGILSYFQMGAPGYQHIQQANKEKYQHARGMIASATAYRRPGKTKVTQRFL